MKATCESKKVAQRKKRFSSDNFGAIIVEGEPNFLPPLAGEHTFHHETEPLAVLEGVPFNVQSSAENIDSGTSNFYKETIIPIAFLARKVMTKVLSI